ncbi:hypothetical protein K457DRAFT_213306 [Linnemannia elongata AG-77]|uniref:Uncharacterized protein n=1 Tax=Linnemannia elongata AG-77 TaxID=1314771 RepID=A0A197K750_9FUNG|nr:hypothetical protein K457DRAFT_213306 [Linnemannia elongata AG-77]
MDRTSSQPMGVSCEGSFSVIFEGAERVGAPLFRFHTRPGYLIHLFLSLSLFHSILFIPSSISLHSLYLAICISPTHSTVIPFLPSIKTCSHNNSNNPRFIIDFFPLLPDSTKQQQPS